MTDRSIPEGLTARAVFLVWGPPAYSNRSRLLAERLGIPVRHVYSTRRRGALAAFVKYPYQAAATAFHFARRRPRLVVVQHPPGLAVLFVAAYAAVSGAAFIVDAHSDAFDSRYWSRPVWMYRRLARRALTTVVTNEHHAAKVRSWGASATVVRDIPTRFEAARYEMGPEFNVAVVATFAPDEPIDELVAAAETMPDVRFRITGDPGREDAKVPPTLPANVELTGFLPLDVYHGLLRDSDAVMALTTRDHTMQRGACEALSHRTPIITSRWPVLEAYFSKGTVHVDNTAGGIRSGVSRMRSDLDRHRQDIAALRDEVEQHWERSHRELVDLVVTAPGLVELAAGVGSRDR